MELGEAWRIKSYLEGELLVKPFELIKSAVLLDGFQTGTYVRTHESINGVGISCQGPRDTYRIDIMLS